MDEFEAKLRREEAIRRLLPIFFASGATALVYQTLWARELHLVFGTSNFAIATVLTAFMAGLALGGFAMARSADDVPKPLVAYGLLEIGIGAYAVAFPFLVQALTPIYLNAWRALEPPPVLFGVIQAVLVGAALLLPTTLMGATLPLLARFATDRMGAAGDRIGTLYAVNTAGAVFGTWLCGFVLLPWLGLWTTTLITAGANLVLGAASLALAAWAQDSERPAAPLEVAGDLRPVMLRVSLAIALAGFASLAYEVAWTRLLVLMLGASVYAFSVMLLAFLSGIALGGRIGGSLADELLERYGQSGVLLGLAAVEVGVAVMSYLLQWVFPELPFWYVWLFDVFGADDSPSRMWPVSMILAGLVMTPPAVLMGVAFPLAVRAVTVEAERLGRPVGGIYGANTAGALVGAGLAGFLLLPMLGVRGTVGVAVGVNLVAAAVILVGQWPDALRGRVRGAMVAIVLASPLLTGLVLKAPWNPLLMTAGMYKYVSELHPDNRTRAGILRYATRYELLYYDEGLSSVVTVARNPDTGNIWLANNGKVDASTSTDMPTQVLVALLPFQFVEDPKDVLVIGLASGITAGSTTTVPAMQRLDVVELEPAIRGAARLFDAHNHAVLDDPRTRLIENDGRNHVLLSAPETYDIIVSEPSNPWISGVSNLFTREFLELGRTRLKPGGVWAQWVQMYGMGPDDLRSLLATFAAVYPHVLVYATIEDADLVILGSDQPIAPDPAIAERFLARYPEAAAELARVEMREPTDLVATYVTDRDGVLAIAGDIELNTDDNMRIEYSAPLFLHQATSVTNMELLVQQAEVPFDAVGPDPVRLVRLARNYLDRDDLDRSLLAMGRALELIAADDPDPEARAYAENVRELVRNEDTGAALATMIEVTRRAEQRQDPSLEVLAEWEEYRDALIAWSREE